MKTVPDDPDHPLESAADRKRRLYLERKQGPTQVLDPAPQMSDDTLWRGLTRDGQARLLVVRATQAAREAAERLESSNDVAKLIGEFLVGALLIRSTLNPEERLQLFVNHEGPVGQLIVDVWDNGGIRAYVKHSHEETATFGFLVGAGVLQVSRSRTFNRQAHQTSVALQGDSVEEFLMHYLLESEQILSLLRIEVIADQGKIQSALGYIVQLMPEGTREDLAQITANLDALHKLQIGMNMDDPDGRQWAEQLLRGFTWDQCAREQVRYQCRCSEDRILAMLSSLPRADIADLAAGVEPLEMTCDYCRTKYNIRPAQVAMLLELPS